MKSDLTNSRLCESYLFIFFEVGH